MYKVEFAKFIMELYIPNTNAQLMWEELEYLIGNGMSILSRYEKNNQL